MTWHTYNACINLLYRHSWWLDVGVQCPPTLHVIDKFDQSSLLGSTASPNQSLSGAGVPSSSEEMKISLCGRCEDIGAQLGRNGLYKNKPMAKFLS